jgi:hypothetical protein
MVGMFTLVDVKMGTWKNNFVGKRPYPTSLANLTKMVVAMETNNL